MTRNKPHKTTPWQIWVDTGGTFTDCLARDPGGRLHRAKVLSSSALRGVVLEQLGPDRLRVQEKWQAPPDFVRGFEFRMLSQAHEPCRVLAYEPDTGTVVLDRPLNLPSVQGAAFEARSPEEAPILAARLVTQTPPHQPLPNLHLRLATTRGTNALLERKGVPVALFITRGFGDLLRIGTQQRPDLFALDIRKPEPLYETVVEVHERLAADGSVLTPLNLQELDEPIQSLLQQGVRVAAVALLHSYRNPTHEHALRDHLRQRGFTHVSCSSELAPFIKILHRAETAVVDAYLAPVIQEYLERVQEAIHKGRLYALTSAGGLVPARDFRAKDSLLSGPAGGVAGAALAGRRSGFERVIAFDMGGTSTDVARYDGDYEYVFEHTVGDAHLVAPALAIESVAAGGGSICAFDGYKLQVGPESAGAQPGPACYGAGGPLTLTDVNLLLGYLQPARFEIPISRSEAERRFEEIRHAIAQSGGTPPNKLTLLQGFLDIANERMADTIRKVSIRKGYDPADYVLVAFGGAGGQHACGVAERLGIRTILVPPDASLLSAYGLGHAVVERFAERQILKTLRELERDLPALLNQIGAEARQAVVAEGVPADRVQTRRRLINLRYVGQDSVLSVEYEEGRALADLFQEKYQEIFGHTPEGREIEVESIRVVCSSRPEEEVPESASVPPKPARPTGRGQAVFRGQRRTVPHFEREHLQPGAQADGPALIFERHSATVVNPGWRFLRDGVGALVLQKVG